MAGAVSPGVENDDLTNNLVRASVIKTPEVQRAFRAVDRGNYVPPELKVNAYSKESACKSGNIHMSAPSIYGMVMEHLTLTPGLSFLNIGSGTGYLSTMVGLILGPSGVNHGMEIYADVVEYANKKLKEFNETFRFGFCEPVFVKGNGLSLTSDTAQYDRVYCGASCPEKYENYMKNLIKVGGVLVMPLGNELLQITRISQTQWEQRRIAGVIFSTLQLPTETDSTNPIHLPKNSNHIPQTSTASSLGLTTVSVTVPACQEEPGRNLLSMNSQGNSSLKSLDFTLYGKEDGKNELTETSMEAAGESSESTTRLLSRVALADREKLNSDVKGNMDDGKSELLENLKEVINRLQEFTECPICFGTLDSTLVQCKNGHGICRFCASKVEKCPSCKHEFVVHQSTLLGQIIECLPKLCLYVGKGCTAITLDKDHERFCKFRPNICKNTLCDWSGCVKDLISHVKKCEKRNVCEISPNTKEPQYFTIDSTQDTFSYTPIIFKDQLFWEYFHRNVTTKQISYRFYHVATSKPTHSYYFIISFKKGRIQHTNSFKALLDIENDNAEDGEIGLILPDSELERFQMPKENDKYEYLMEVATEDIP